jgi:hypothetical protein
MSLPLSFINDAHHQPQVMFASVSARRHGSMTRPGIISNSEQHTCRQNGLVLSRALLLLAAWLFMPHVPGAATGTNAWHVDCAVVGSLHLFYDRSTSATG